MVVQREHRVQRRDGHEPSPTPPLGVFKGRFRHAPAPGDDRDNEDDDPGPPSSAGPGSPGLPYFQCYMCGFLRANSRLVRQFEDGTTCCFYCFIGNLGDNLATEMKFCTDAMHEQPRRLFLLDVDDEDFVESGTCRQCLRRDDLYTPGRSPSIASLSSSRKTSLADLRSSLPQSPLGPASPSPLGPQQQQQAPHGLQQRRQSGRNLLLPEPAFPSEDDLPAGLNAIALRPEDVVLLSNFHMALNQENMEECSCCQERWFGLEVFRGICKRCRAKDGNLQSDQPFLFSAANNVDFGDVPDELP